MSRFTYFSTFTGIGGFENGIHNAFRTTVGGVQTNPQADEETGTGLVATQGQDTRATDGRVGSGVANGTDQRPLCVGYSEIDKYATAVYEKHFKGVKNYGDITKINADELPDFDCLVGGFPCQAFSIAGKRAGFDDTRGTLFFDLARILRAKQPRLFVFENVKGLLSHKDGQTFGTIISTLDELGYDVQWQVLNSKNFGVPQNRERVIIIGHLRGESQPEVFPIGGFSEKTLVEITRNVSDAQRIYTTNLAKSQKALDDSMGAKTGLYAVHKNNGAIEQTEDQSHALDANYHKGLDNHGQRTGIAAAKIITGQPKYGTDGKRSVEYTVSDEAPTLRATHYKNGDNQPRVLISETVDMQVRRLTPLECERLQGFPDGWTKEGASANCNGTICVAGKVDACSGHFIDMSDSQRYKMCGNAVTTNVIQAVFERIFATCL